MKKTLLSFFVVFIFTFYVVTTRGTDFTLPVSAEKKDETPPPSTPTDSNVVVETQPKSTAPSPSPKVVQPKATKPVPTSKPSAPSSSSSSQPTPTSSNPSPVSTSTTGSPSGTPQPSPSTTPVSSPPTTSSGAYKDGTYTGSVADAFYGFIQVEAVIQDGKIADINFLRFPNDRSTSIEINTQAMPYLKTEAIQAQSANVDIVSGATDSSIAFRESLSSALAKAKN